MPPLTLIDTPAALDAEVAALSGARWLAVDTEFYRERTYRPQLCLLQIATPTRVALVDAVTLEDLTPVIDLLYTPGVIKVLHAARQDLELFYWMRGSVPRDLFDTQVAAPLLGHADQIGYGNLVREVVEVELEKAFKRTDWKRRPLDQEHLQYAADDVIYLAKMYPIMRDKLEELGKLDELEPRWEELSRPELYEPPADQMYLKVKGHKRLRADALEVLKALASWRELTARERDLPRGWLLKDGVLMALARRQPRRMEELYKIKDLSPKTIKRRGKVLLRIIRESAGS